MIASYPYDTQYNPPMPIVEIGISSVDETEPRVKTNALVDSGADVTMLPIWLLEDAETRHVEQLRVKGITGHSILVQEYIVAIHIENEIFHGIRVFSDDTMHETIIGRNLLNRMRVTLDGPAEITEFA